MKIIYVRLTTLGADCSGREVYGVGLWTPNCSGREVYGVDLWPPNSWDFGFEFRRGHVCLSVCLL
jgi:hypothetical protein